MGSTSGLSWLNKGVKTSRMLRTAEFGSGGAATGGWDSDIVPLDQRCEPVGKRLRRYHVAV